MKALPSRLTENGCGETSLVFNSVSVSIQRRESRGVYRCRDSLSNGTTMQIYSTVKRFHYVKIRFFRTNEVLIICTTQELFDLQGNFATALLFKQ